jgi:hypothetical protein
LGSVFFSALDMEFIRGGEEIAFALSALRFRNLESWEDVSLSRISLEGDLNYGAPELQASLKFDSFSALDILEMARPFGNFPDFPSPLSPFIGNTSLTTTTEIFITTDFSQVLYNVPHLAVAFEGQRRLIAQVSLSGTGRHIEVSEGSIAWPGGGINVTGSADFSNTDYAAFDFRASWQEQAYYLEGFMNPSSLDIRGSYGLSVYLGADSSGGYSGYLEVDSLPVSINDQFARFSISASARYAGPDSWYADLSRFQVSNLATPVSPSTELRVSGSADRNGVRLRDLYFDDGRGELWGEADFSWNSAPPDGVPPGGILPGGVPQPNSPEYSGVIRMERRRLGEYYEVSGTYTEGRLGLTVKGEQMQLERVFKNALGALVSGEGYLEWKSGEDWSAEALINSLTARNGDTELALQANVFVNPAELRVRGLRASYGALEAESPSLMIDRSAAVAQTNARVWGTALGRTMETNLSARAEFAAVESWADAGAMLDSFTGFVNVDYTRFGALENREPFDLRFSRSEAGFALSGGPRNMIRAALADDGAFFAAISYPSPIRGTMTGVLSSRTIDASVPDLYVDMVSLWDIIPSNDVINCTGGFVDAQVRIRGPLGDPEFFGTARGNSIRLSVPDYLNAEIGPVPIPVTLDGNGMRFGPVNAPCGGGYGEVSGSFRFDRWIPDTLEITIQAGTAAPIPFSLEVAGVMAAGNASGSLVIAYADEILRVTGNLTGEDTEITLDPQKIAAAADGQEPDEDVPVIADFTLVTGRKVEFFWPDSNNPILRANASAGTVIRIESDSADGRFSMNGNVNLRSGEIFYVQRSFYIRSGALSFNENELQFVPRLTVRAEIRDRTDDGPVTISMIVDNEPLMSFDARFESSPPLSQIDILSLLGQNLTGESQTEGEAMDLMLSSTTDIAFQFLGIRRVERTVRDFLGLDMFSFRTQLISNAVSGLRNSAGSDSTSRGFGNYLDNTTVFVGKYLSPDMFFQGMFTLRYIDMPGAGEELYRADSSGITMGQLILEPDISIELQSPLFNIGWNITPVHVENLFINDTSFSLTWRFVF